MPKVYTMHKSEIFFCAKHRFVVYTLDKYFFVVYTMNNNRKQQANKKAAPIKGEMNMKITATFIKQLAKAIENSCFITAYDVRIEDSDEWIIRYENGNNCTISLYFYHSYANDEHDGYTIGYYNDNAETAPNAKYHTFGWCENLNDISKETAIMNIALTLHDVDKVAYYMD